MRFILAALALSLSSCGSPPQGNSGEVTITLPPPSPAPGFAAAVSRP